MAEKQNTTSYPKEKVRILFLENISDIAVKNFKQNGYVKVEKINKALTEEQLIQEIKDVHILMRAYNDAAGLTRDFNLNLLSRINNELGADFDLNSFRHYATYNVYTGAMESYLISLKQQTVNIAALNQAYHFESIEPIHVEYSFKYSLPQIETLLANTGFTIVDILTDNKNYFADVVCQVKK